MAQKREFQTADILSVTTGIALNRSPQDIHTLLAHIFGEFVVTTPPLPWMVQAARNFLEKTLPWTQNIQLPEMSDDLTEQKRKTLIQSFMREIIATHGKKLFIELLEPIDQQQIKDFYSIILPKKEKQGYSYLQVAAEVLSKNGVRASLVNDIFHTVFSKAQKALEKDPNDARNLAKFILYWSEKQQIMELYYEEQSADLLHQIAIDHYLNPDSSYYNAERGENILLEFYTREINIPPEKYEQTRQVFNILHNRVNYYLEVETEHYKPHKALKLLTGIYCFLGEAIPVMEFFNSNDDNPQYKNMIDDQKQTYTAFDNIIIDHYLNPDSCSYSPQQAEKILNLLFINYNVSHIRTTDQKSRYDQAWYQVITAHYLDANNLNSSNLNEARDQLECLFSKSDISFNDLINSTIDVFNHLIDSNSKCYQPRYAHLALNTIENAINEKSDELTQHQINAILKRFKTSQKTIESLKRHIAIDHFLNKESPFYNPDTAEEILCSQKHRNLDDIDLTLIRNHRNQSVGKPSYTQLVQQLKCN